MKRDNLVIAVLSECFIAVERCTVEEGKPTDWESVTATFSVVRLLCLLWARLNFAPSVACLFGAYGDIGQVQWWHTAGPFVDSTFDLHGWAFGFYLQ